MQTGMKIQALRVDQPSRYLKKAGETDGRLSARPETRK